MKNVLIAVLLWTAPALAFEPPGPPPSPPEEAGEMGMGEFEGIATKLGLNEQQREQVRQIVHDSNQARIDLQAKSQKADAELKHLLMSATLDEKAVNKALDAANAADGELRRNRVQLAISLRKIVNAEQWRQLQDLRRDRMQERMRERGEGPEAP